MGPGTEGEFFYDIFVTVQDGGKMGAKAGVKLAYTSVFVPIFTSDGHPILLDRLFRSRRRAVQNCYIFSMIFNDIVKKCWCFYFEHAIMVH